MTSLAGVRLGVVEDEALIAMLTEDALTEAGAEISASAARVGDALVLIEAGGLDAIVLDLNLGGEDGRPVVERAAQVGLPCVVVTGYGRDGLPSHLQHVPLLVKPYKPEDLVAAVQKALRVTP
jgi:CheY-like chemotaxis protein